MNESIFTLLENKEIAPLMYEMRLQGDTCAITAPGQFVNIRLDGFFLRRPISVCAVQGDVLTLLYKVVGDGTRAMAAMAPGQKLAVLCGLGNGYDLGVSGQKPLLIGGGAGIPPMYQLCRDLRAQGRDVTVILGFNTAAEAFYQAEFEALGARVLPCTVDGTLGTRGFVTAALSEAGEYTHVYTCGPEPMLRAVYDATTTGGQYSFEERMGCGFGACMGCTCKTKYGDKRICKDGPVLVKEEIIW